VADFDFPRVEAASDHSLLVAFAASPDTGAHEQVRRLLLSLREAPRAGVLNLHPAYASLLVDFDPLRVGVADLAGGASQRRPLRRLPRRAWSKSRSATAANGGQTWRQWPGTAAWRRAR
jgi:allophanate hydrolase subunit 1